MNTKQWSTAKPIILAWVIFLVAFAVGKIYTWTFVEPEEPICGPVLDVSAEVHGYREVCNE